MSDHFGTLCIKGLRSLASQFISDTASCKFEVMFDYLIFYGCAKLITLLLIIVKQSPEVLYKKSCSTLLKRNSNTVVFLWILRNFKNPYFECHLRTAPFDNCVPYSDQMARNSVMSSSFSLHVQKDYSKSNLET